MQRFSRWQHYIKRVARGVRPTATRTTTTPTTATAERWKTKTSSFWPEPPRGVGSVRFWGQQQQPPRGERRREIAHLAKICLNYTHCAERHFSGTLLLLEEEEEEGDLGLCTSVYYTHFENLQELPFGDN